MKAIYTVLLLIWLAGVLGAAEMVWDGENKFAGVRLKPGVTLKENILRQEVTAPDSQIIFTGKVDTGKMNNVEIIYRAEGIPKRTSGQIFFAEHNKSIDGKTHWILPSLKGDGEWHVIHLTASEKTIRNYPAWRDAATPVTVIRLDMLDQGPGGFVEIKSLRFFAEEKE